jgi:hypothetical protein
LTEGSNSLGARRAFPATASFEYNSLNLVELICVVYSFYCSGLLVAYKILQLDALQLERPVLVQHPEHIVGLLRHLRRRGSCSRGRRRSLRVRWRRRRWWRWRSWGRRRSDCQGLVHVPALDSLKKIPLYYCRYFQENKLLFFTRATAARAIAALWLRRTLSSWIFSRQ